MKRASTTSEAGNRMPSFHVGRRLAELRRFAGIAAEELASRLGIKLPSLLKLESEPDLAVSTLDCYVAALDANLKIDVVFGKSNASEHQQLTLPMVDRDSLALDRDVVFSIKPEYCKKIVDGTKTVELRRRFPTSTRPGTTALIYATSPQRALFGIAQIARVTKLPTNQIWTKYQRCAGVTRKEFDEYFSGLNIGVAIELRGAKALTREVELSELRRRFNFEPPQSFLYAPQAMREALRNEYLQVSH